MVTRLQEKNKPLEALTKAKKTTKQKRYMAWLIN